MFEKSLEKISQSFSCARILGTSCTLAEFLGAPSNPGRRECGVEKSDGESEDGLGSNFDQFRFSHRVRLVSSRPLELSSSSSASKVIHPAREPLLPSPPFDPNDNTADKNRGRSVEAL